MFEQTTWSVENGELGLLRNGSHQRLTADEIFAAVFEGSEGVIATPDELSFSSVPASLFAELTYNPARGGSGLTLSFFAESGNESTQVVSITTGPDHVLIKQIWFALAHGAREELAEELDKAGIADAGPLTLRQYLHLRKRCSDALWLIDRTGSDIHPGIDTSPQHGTPNFVLATLYPYQEAGWRWLSYIHQEGLGAILGDEMGLGKTLQIITLLASPHRADVAPSLIVCPSTLMENWRRELARFAPQIETFIHQGSDRTGNYRELSQHDVVITSYDTAVRDGSLFRMLEWQLLVLDEAQAIKNPDTKRAKSVKQLRRRVGIAVTGTPIENKLRDLWSLIDFALPDYLGSLEVFEQTFSDDLAGARQLEPLVSPLMLRRRVAEVAQDLPEKIIIPQTLVLSESEAEEYERIRKQTLEEYGRAGSLVALTRLRMFCAHPFLLEDANWTVSQSLSFSKYQRLLEILDEIFASGEKCILFTTYNRLASFVKQTVRERYGFFAETINGETAITERQNIVDSFSAVRGAGILALNPRAAGAGLNITAATHVIHYNLEWNPAIEDQASARAYRRGQDRPVTIHRLYYAETVEEVIDERLTRKRELSETAVVGIEGEEGDYGDILRALQASPIRSVQ